MSGKNRRDKTVLFRVSPEEYDLMQQKAALAGIVSLSAYIRKMAIDGYVIKLELPELREMISLLRRSSNNLNQENICQGGFHPKDEIPLINGNLLKNSPLSCFQAFQDPESDRLKNSIKAIAQHYADQICNQVCDVRGAVEERL